MACTYVLGSSARRIALNLVPGLRLLIPAWTAPTRLSSSRSATEWTWNERMPDGCEGDALALPSSCTDGHRGRWCEPRAEASEEEGRGATHELLDGVEPGALLLLVLLKLEFLAILKVDIGHQVGLLLLGVALTLELLEQREEGCGRRRGRGSGPMLGRMRHRGRRPDRDDAPTLYSISPISSSSLPRSVSPLGASGRSLSLACLRHLPARSCSARTGRSRYPKELRV